MKFVSVKDFRTSSASIWERLPSEGEMIVTNNGKPIALLTPLSDETLEDTVSAVRRAKAINAVKKMQEISAGLENDKMSLEEINTLITDVRGKKVYDNRIIFEYVEVLLRKDFGFDITIIHDMIDYFKNDGEFINSEYINMQFIDEMDKKFYEVYKYGEAQYLITGNIKHFPKENNIITPRAFIELFYN